MEACSQIRLQLFNTNLIAITSFPTQWTIIAKGTQGTQQQTSYRRTASNPLHTLAKPTNVFEPILPNCQTLLGGVQPAQAPRVL